MRLHLKRSHSMQIGLVQNNKSINDTMESRKKPLAIIITTNADHNKAFVKNKGYFKVSLQQLVLHNYEIIEIEGIKDPKDIKKILVDVEPSTIGFFWIRGHGQPKKIAFSDQSNLLANEVEEIFHWLPQKLQTNAVIYLECCNVGSLEEDFYNNIQFNFAKLTQEMLNVKIIAPSQASYLEKFTINKNGEFEFISRPAYSQNNSIIVIDKEIKELLTNIKPDEDIKISKEKLLNELKSSNGTFNHLISYKYLEQNNLKSFSALYMAIKYNDLDAAQELITIFNLDINKPIKSYHDAGYFAICLAIDTKSIKSINFLLEKNVDIFALYNNVSPLNYLLNKSYNSPEIFYLEAWNYFEKHVHKANNQSLRNEFIQQREEYRMQAYNMSK